MFKTTKAKLIFVAIFCFICILATTLLIVYKRIDIEPEEVENNIAENKEIEKDFPGVDKKGKYNQNDLEIIEKKAATQKVEFSYIKIDGLKNKKIQDKINQEIETEALNCYRDKIDLEKVVNVSVETWCYANFADTLSVNIYYWGKIDDDSDDVISGNKGFNYDLNTGNKIELKELFTSDAPIEEILRNSSYYSLVNERAEYTLSGDLVVNNYGDIEEDITDIIQQYYKGNLTEFVFSPTDITIYYGENSIKILLEDWAEYIAIYNKFLSNESLYDTDDIGYRNLYNFTERYTDMYYYTNYQNEENYLIEINLDWTNEENSTDFERKLVEDKISSIEKEISKFKVIANENKENFYIMNYYIQVYSYDEISLNQNLVSYFEVGNTYDMTVHDYEENVENYIIDFYKNSNEGGFSDYVYYLDEYLKIEPQRTEEYYNPKTGEKVVI